MKNAVEIEELALDIARGKESLISVLTEYERKMENLDEDAIFDRDMKIDFLKAELSRCIDEMNRLLGLLDGDTRKVNKRHTNKIINAVKQQL